MFWKEESPCTVSDMWVSFMTQVSVPETESAGEAAHLDLCGSRQELLGRTPAQLSEQVLPHP